MTLAIGDTAPDLTLAAERAIAAVAVMPPKNGEIILPKPWASKIQSTVKF